MKLKLTVFFTLSFMLAQIFAPLPVSAAPVPAITAPSAILLDGDTNRILFEKTPNLRRAPASTTKLLTALVALERMDLNTVVTIPGYVENTPPSKINLKQGEKYRVRELVRALLINSANDAAEALAYAGGNGSRAAFVEAMNRKAASLGCKNSHWENPSGLPSDGGGQYSTAYDMSLIMDEVQKQPFLVQTLSIRTLIIKSFAGRKIYLRNHNRMLWSNSHQVIGKTGWTRVARHCFVGEFYTNNRKLVVAMLGSHALWRDLRTIVDSQFGRSIRKAFHKDDSWAERPNVRTIQTALKKAGFYKGSINGKYGRKTKKAVKKFQKSKGMKVTGSVGPQTWAALAPFAS